MAKLDYTNFIYDPIAIGSCKKNKKYAIV